MVCVYVYLQIEDFAHQVSKAEDLPLNVSRETLQSTAFLRQLKSIILKRIIQLFNKMADLQTEDSEKFEKFYEIFGGILKLGAVEDQKNRDKLTAITRFTTTHRNFTTLDQVSCLCCDRLRLFIFTIDSGSISKTESKARSRYSSAHNGQILFTNTQYRFFTWQRWARVLRNSRRVFLWKSFMLEDMKFFCSLNPWMKYLFKTYVDGSKSDVPRTFNRRLIVFVETYLSRILRKLV